MKTVVKIETNAQSWASVFALPVRINEKVLPIEKREKDNFATIGIRNANITQKYRAYKLDRLDGAMSTKTN